MLPEVGLLIAEADYNRLMNPLLRCCSKAVLKLHALRDFYNLAHKHTKIWGLLRRYFGETKIRSLPRGVKEKPQNTSVKTSSLSFHI